ncbi:hypothetical protein DVH24_023543 [Malus domestica]|uniref:Uncharacterized protein n=1 Tax=Malus domestica TaxID=3750 RepID=A0A498I2Z0_MALDO|nr:hypothetical protein DVH24_023543 [Malus domestica]
MRVPAPDPPVEQPPPAVVFLLLRLYPNKSSSSSYQMNRFFHDQKEDSLEAVAMEHPRMNGECWCLTTLDLLGKLQAVDVDEVVSWVLHCQHDSSCYII